MEHLDERAYSYPVPTGLAMYNARGAFYPAALQRMAVGVIEAHLEQIGWDAPKLVREHGLSWVLLSFSAEVKKPLLPGVVYRAQTWHTHSKGPVFRREFCFTDQDGEIAVVGATFSSLLDVKKHRLCIDREILAQFQKVEREMLLDAEYRYRLTPPFEPVETRTVRPSWIDGLGHVNNMRYADLAYDALSAEEREKIDRFTRMDMWFLRELTADAAFTMEKYGEENAVTLRGVIDDGGKPSFVVKLVFGMESL